jgi:hypothetical protein
VRLLQTWPTPNPGPKTLQDPKRKAECEALFGGELPGNDFDRLVDLGKRITDFAPSTALPDEPVAGDALDEDIGVAVEFEGEDEEEDSEGDEVVVRPVPAPCGGEWLAAIGPMGADGAG